LGPCRRCLVLKRGGAKQRVKILGTLDPKIDVITVRTIEPGSPSASKRSPPK
jgi:hypothetical protein